ncbi:MAG: hypothetical protein R3D02_16005 [Hyphomicrobiales bacterium]
MVENVLKKVRLNMARTREFPAGSALHGYEFIAPLDETGHIDAEGWRKQRDKCRVRRFWGSEEDEVGHLVHKPGGSWAFHYDIDGDDDDEAGYKFGAHAFAPGEYVSIRDEDGELIPFVVVLVENF